jgi:hypothetical protein
MIKSQASALGVFIVLGLIFLGARAIYEAMGIVVPLIILIAVIVAFVWHAENQKKKRLEYLRGKYGDEAIVQLIVHHRFWQGQSSEQLIDSVGNPVSIDRNIFKTKTRETWKYSQRGVNRFGLRISLENGVVVGWDQKS